MGRTYIKSKPLILIRWNLLFAVLVSDHMATCTYRAVPVSQRHSIAADTCNPAMLPRY